MRVPAILLLCFVSAIIGCSSGKPSGSNPDDVITIGSGGGVSGAFSGFRIKRNGEVTAWRRMNAAASDSDFARVKTSADSVDFFFRYLDEIRFGELQYEKLGEMTFYVERSLPTLHRITWADNPEEGPPELTVFSRLVTMYVSRHLQQ